MRLVLGTATLLVMCACSRSEAPVDTSRYMFVWAGDADNRAGDSDFLAVIDIDSTSARYAQVVATLPIGAVHTMPHHTESQMPPDGHALFANAFMPGRTYLFDLTNPLQPRIAGTIDTIPGLRQPHSYFRLPDGRVVATVQFGDGRTRGDPGGLAMLTPDGRVLRTSSSSDKAFPGAAIRTYSLDVSRAGDRVLTTSTPMDNERTADVVQLWRLSDLSLQRTIAMPASPNDSAWRLPFEVRFLDADGRRAFMNTWNCGFYLLSGLDGPKPTIERAMTLPNPKIAGCGVPLLWGKYWIMPVGDAREFLVLDISDPRQPKVASRLAADSSFYPHWISRDPWNDRVILTTEGPTPRVMIARFDSTSGTLQYDERFRESTSGMPGVSFARETWPHGASGPAKPHGAIFGPPPHLDSLRRRG
ncbi:MAG TPA: hypothetical protein VGQ52_13645 [Gemmatimonadaceae bacterium]|nr:hypothetical protein [Gemmatimonadaceae bacterium]